MCHNIFLVYYLYFVVSALGFVDQNYSMWLVAQLVVVVASSNALWLKKNHKFCRNLPKLNWVFRVYGSVFDRYDM